MDATCGQTEVCGNRRQGPFGSAAAKPFLSRLLRIGSNAAGPNGPILFDFWRIVIIQERGGSTLESLDLTEETLPGDGCVHNAWRAVPR